MKVTKKIDARSRLRLARFEADDSAKLERLGLAAGRASRKLARLERMRQRLQAESQDTMYMVLESLGFKPEYGPSLQIDEQGNASWEDGSEDPGIVAAREAKLLEDSAKALGERGKHRHDMKVLEGSGKSNGS